MNPKVPFPVQDRFPKNVNPVPQAVVQPQPIKKTPKSGESSYEKYHRTKGKER